MMSHCSCLNSDVFQMHDNTWVLKIYQLNDEVYGKPIKYCPYCGAKLEDVIDWRAFGRRVKELRKSYGTKTAFTQSKASKKIGINYDMYCRYEQGRRKPTMDRVEKIARFYGVSVGYLLGTEEYHAIDYVREG
jgi:DNA-binding XRE family transcriptional regulator